MERLGVQTFLRLCYSVLTARRALLRIEYGPIAPPAQRMSSGWMTAVRRGVAPNFYPA